MLLVSNVQRSVRPTLRTKAIQRRAVRDSTPSGPPAQPRAFPIGAGPRAGTQVPLDHLLIGVSAKAIPQFLQNFASASLE